MCVLQWPWPQWRCRSQSTNQWRAANIATTRASRRCATGQAKCSWCAELSTVEWRSADVCEPTSDTSAASSTCSTFCTAAARVDEGAPSMWWNPRLEIENRATLSSTTTSKSTTFACPVSLLTSPASSLFVYNFSFRYLSGLIYFWLIFSHLSVFFATLKFIRCTNTVDSWSSYTLAKELFTAVGVFVTTLFSEATWLVLTGRDVTWRVLQPSNQCFYVVLCVIMWS